MTGTPPPRHTWQNRVETALEVAEESMPPRYGHERIVFRTTAGGYIRDAAAIRGITVSGFVRRATLAMAAEILDIPLPDLIAADPTIQLEGGYFPAPDPSGRIGGPWQITGLEEASEAPLG